MPVNSQGGYALNKHVAARQDAMANVAGPEMEGNQDTPTGGVHSVAIHKTPQGFHSVTDSEGGVEHQDHASYEDAKSHMDSKFAGSGDEESDGDGSEQMTDESGEDNENCV